MKSRTIVVLALMLLTTPAQGAEPTKTIAELLGERAKHQATIKSMSADAEKEEAAFRKTQPFLDYEAKIKALQGKINEEAVKLQKVEAVLLDQVAKEKGVGEKK